VKPIIEKQEGGGPRQVGTAFSLGRGNTRLVVTANHVVS
jgi:hypothetical protein